MKVSLHGLFSGIEASLRSSKDDYACMYAFSLMELGDHLRMMARGDATMDEFFALYVTNKDDKSSWAQRVDKRKYDCMQEEPADVEQD
jgi:hypothetical protein